MKNKLYASFFIGVGLAITSTCSYGKPHHSAPKRQAIAAAKHIQRSMPGHHLSNRIAGKHQHIIAEMKHAAKHSPGRTHTQFSTKRPNKHHPLERRLPPFVENRSKLDEEVQKIIDAPEPVKLSESKHRIHALIPSDNSQDQIEQPLSREESDHHYATAHGIIKTSLAAAGEEVGLSDELTLEITNIFAWDIDFASDLRRGDQFIVVYENTLDGGQRVAAAEFVNQGRILTAVRFEDDDGNSNFYTPEGKAMRKAFLSTPVDYARISSHFDANRKHPILNRIRAHKGTDYAARIGTPVKAAGDGTIAFAGRKGGYGDVLIIKHGERYETLYAHLSRFRRDIQEGDNVKQGEVIGYVGQSGLATGPHLHYEFRIDGVHQNPEAQNSRQAMTLSNKHLVVFKHQAQPVLSALYHTKAKSLLAKNQQKIN